MRGSWIQKFIGTHSPGFHASNAAAQGGGGCGCAMVTVVVIGVVGFLCFKPEAIRTGVQVPVGVSVRPSLLVITNVVQVRNESGKRLTGVVISAKNAAQNSSATYRIGVIDPGQVVEVGWGEWNWKVEPGETLTITADGFLPIVFSSAQLGVR
jgi:hypothetical protein